MLRPLNHFPHDELESDDSASFGGLADVLEPDGEDFDDAVTSLRHLSPASVRNPSVRNPSVRNPSLRGLDAGAPVSVRTVVPVQVQDFAFADTVFSSGDLSDEPPPPSGPIYVNDPFGAHTQCVTPLAFPLPPAAEEIDFATRMRVLAAHMRHAVRRSREEMRELWAGTVEIVASDSGAPPSFLQRVLALWSCFQWSRADVLRAAMIGIAVFVVAGTIGAATIDFGDAAAASSEVRAGRTLVQHTGKKIVIRAKR